MLWVYDYYKYFYSYSAGIDFSRQILTTKVDPCAVRLKSISRWDYYLRGLSGVSTRGGSVTQLGLLGLTDPERQATATTTQVIQTQLADPESATLTS